MSFILSSLSSVGACTTYSTISHQLQKLMSFFHCLGCVKESVQVWGALKHFITSQTFHGEGLLAWHPTPKLEDHHLSAVHDCLFIYEGLLLHLQPEDVMLWWHGTHITWTELNWIWHNYEIRLIKMCLNETYGKVCIGKNLTHFSFIMVWNKEMLDHHRFSLLL
jgi:hypothetical protein